MASILVVDDELEMCGLLQALLEGAGHKVMTTTDPRQVEGLVEQGLFDLVVADVVMPHRDGIEIVKEVRMKHAKVGVIAMSGAAPLRRELYLEAGKMFGADATFTKPFRRDEVLESVAQALKKAADR